MKLKVTKKLADLSFSTKELIKSTDGAKIKGGGWYYCCARNKWINY